MNDCPTRIQLEDWAKQGSATTIPEASIHHAEQCAGCAEFVRSVKLGRSLGQLLPTVTISGARHDEMKFLLMAESRKSRPTGGLRLLPSNLRLRLFAVAAIVASAAGAATAAHRYLAASPTSMKLSQTGDEAKQLSPMSTNLRLHVVAPQLPQPVVSGAATEVSAPLQANLASKPTTGATTIRPTTTANGADAAFSEAWQALRANRPSDAAKRFDGLLASSILDAARRADILYWSAQAHRQAGNSGAATTRSMQLLREFPSAPFAADAALMLGEYALASDQFEVARNHLSHAATSQHAVVRERARRALAKLADRQ